MKVAKFTVKGKDKFMQVVRVSSVKFDPRPGWVLVRDMHVQPAFQDVQWVHPDDVKFHWVREFA
jgi:hypothetical protein